MSTGVQAKKTQKKKKKEKGNWGEKDDPSFLPKFDLAKSFFDLNITGEIFGAAMIFFLVGLEDVWYDTEAKGRVKPTGNTVRRPDTCLIPPSAFILPSPHRIGTPRNQARP